MLTQKEAVYNAITSVIDFEDGDKVELTKEQKANVVSLVVAGFQANEVALSDNAREKFSDSKKLTTYTGGMVNNWMRKDTRINGGDKYITKNPGSRAGSGDATMKNLKLLKSTLTDEDKIAQVETAIEARKTELAAEKAKSVEIDYSQIPVELLETLNIES